MTGRRTATATSMGTVMSIAAPADTDPEMFSAATQAAFTCLRHADDVFSPFKAASPISRIRDGRLPLADLAEHPDAAWIREVLDICSALKAQTGGAFDAWAVGDPPAFDPCGAVKGWAAEQAGATLTAHGVTRHSLGAGGDVRVRGDCGDRPWRVGITDPHRPGRLLAVAELRDGAVATSGTTERGAHIWDPKAGRPASYLSQVTVIGPSLTWADGYATAAMALGAQAFDWLSALAERTAYDALVVDRRTGVRWTPGMPKHVPALASAV
ncbi:FAD:protein FMN transferase [Actinoallomurus oryzae]|uniref:FAD:protein FMN transferase n=1 Tax=Actinoallomurus oryzae TaxID=502180 RepID=A0ABP8QGE2_9ACTN